LSRTSAAAASVNVDAYANFDALGDLGEAGEESEGFVESTHSNEPDGFLALAEPIGSSSAGGFDALNASANPSDRPSGKPAEMSDQELLEGIRAKSEIHFAEMYNRYFQRIYNFVYSRMHNHAETEEVVQETFLAVFRSFENYRGQSSLLSWVYGIAKNTTNNSLRRAKSQHERIDLADEDDLIPRPSIGVGSPDEQLDLHRFREHLTQRLDSLASWQAEIFEMRHFENLSIPEISERTSRSSDAVRSSLYRVKRIFIEAAMANGAPVMALGGEQQ
jgi:RNA polymerase sigma-70 factor (ECF subfamily)